MTNSKTVWLLQGYDDPYLAPFTMLVDNSIEEIVAKVKKGMCADVDLVKNEDGAPYPYSLRVWYNDTPTHYEITEATLGEWIG